MAQTSFEIDENTAAALDHLKKVYGVPSNAAVLKRALARISHTIFARSIGSADDFLSWQELARRRGVGRRVARVEVFGAAGAA